MLSDMTHILFDGPQDADLTLVLAHGAGAAMDSPFMAAFAQGLGARGIAVARFEFPYMAARRATGKKRPPDRQPILLQTWREVIAQLGEQPGIRRLAIGGKSMGGRMASLLAAEGGQDISDAVGALVCLGYPFHPAGKPDRLRNEHLAALSLPSLIVQGERDPLGNRADVAGYPLSRAIELHWCPDGNHDLAPRKRSGYSQEDNWTGAMDAVAGFLQSKMA
ncbi:MAG: alpha/beta hydrolase [Alphaproteobacteria bacterium]|nr:alpha/beta hydrolase [Alphaproteobacteria bacterium]